MVEDCEIPPKQEMVKLAGPMEEHTEEQKQHIKDLIKRYWAHTVKAHKEASAAASILRLLADEVDKQTYVALINSGTRLLIMMEVPQMASQAAEMKIKGECQEKAKNLRNQPIEQIIDEQNILVPVEIWESSSIMLPTQYLAAMVYYFMLAEADPKHNVTNKGMAALFKLSPSNLHKLVSGKKYHGGSHGESHKASSLKELENHGELMVQVIRKKTPKMTKMSMSTSAATGSSKSGGKAGKLKSSSKVTVMKTMLKLIALPFLEDETPASGTRGARKKKKEGDDSKE